MRIARPARARRRAFEGGARELVRLLVWVEAPLPSPPARRALAAQVAEAASRRAGGHAPAARLGAPALPEARRRLGVILEMLRGVPPGGLAARERIPEPGLYRLRDAALAAAESALAGEVRTRTTARWPGRSRGWAGGSRRARRPAGWWRARKSPLRVPSLRGRRCACQLSDVVAASLAWDEGGV
ncbi:hypothetical protein SCE1572_11520 [Sorangium cellulosum So0157-2]|uniref:Uncharacterized protein n=1 Tax=Sorangium cellulosum So0157-2 TaxID=1254432 RepID=S4XT71_SORCE|nr:hypothetical protein SCE1572_11520 [Sorangium cellulosum So0157-2]